MISFSFKFFNCQYLNTIKAMNLEVVEEFNTDPGRRKTAVLSAEELFRWRKKEVLPVPQRGGIKDFEPDGSWLQAKRLETFCEEHLSVLSEPRVEKSGNLVKGTWDSEMKLVNIKKTAKFWMKMGFADSDRNWLHPEEALFLMEVNCLDLIHHGVSLSLQEAFSLLLHPSCNVTEEEYQVYAHLRRLGYIVLRHAGKLDVTSYEMKIGLHNYTKKKNKKSSGKAQQKSKCSEDTSKVHPVVEAHTDRKTSDSDSASALECAVLTYSARSEKQSENNNKQSCVEVKRLCKDNKKESLECPKQSAAEKGDCTQCERSSEDNQRDSPECRKHFEESSSRGLEITESPLPTPKGKRINCVEDMSKTSNSLGTSKEPPKKKMKLDRHCGSSSTLSPELDCQSNSDPWLEATQLSFSRPSSSSLTEWDFSAIEFPDMGGKDTVSLSIPPLHCLPPNTCMDEDYEDICMFDVEEYRQQQMQQSAVIDQGDNMKHLKQLEFSYAEWHKENFRPLAARNWREWKEEFCKREKSFLYDSPVAHLWQEEVTPLVQPQHSHSTDSLLQRLSVIQPYQGRFPAKKRQEKVNISFDVYLPNTSFRKSNPGLPDHRVCVARGPNPPDVFDVHAATAHLDDRVPLHWAVVSSGDICFFVFEDIDLPVHPSALG